MKTINRFVILITSVSLSFGSTSYGQESHVITLDVITGEIVKQNVNPYCNFGQDQTSSNEEFTIYVRNGDNITWVGVSSDAPSTDIVNITSINYQGGKNLFGRNVLKDTRENPGIVNGTVQNGVVGDEEKYVVSFKVINNGVKRKGTFHIDPKIKVH